MTCAQVKEILMNIVLDEAEPDDHLRIKSHLEICEACRAAMNELSLTRKLVVQGLPQEEPPRRTAFVTTGAASPTGWFGFLWQRAFTVPLGVAAALVLVLATLALAHARVGVQQGRWELAFGAAPAVSAPATQSTSVPLVAPASFTQEQVRQIVAAAVNESETRQRAESAALVEAAMARTDQRNVAALQTFAEQIRYLQQKQTVLAKQNESTLSYVATNASFLPDKGARQ